MYYDLALSKPTITAVGISPQHAPGTTLALSKPTITAVGISPQHAPGTTYAT